MTLTELEVRARGTDFRTAYFDSSMSETMS